MTDGYMINFDHLIIGNGIAGVAAAEEIRKRQPDAAIAIVSEEDEPCYSRVLLPHYVKGKIPRDKVFRKTRSWYAEAGISVFWARQAVRLDPVGHAVTMDDGSVLGYRQLLIASGGRAKRMSVSGDDHEAVLPFRTLADADRICDALDRVAALPAAEQEAAIVGGGFIGLEFPSIFSGRGFRTSLLIRGPYYWSRTWDKTSADIVESTLTAHGIRLYKGINAIAFSGDNSSLLHGVQTDNEGEIPARVAGYGVGLEMNFAPAREAGIDTNLGIMTNEYLETSAPDVYAAGDVAEFWDITVGRRHRLGNWINALSQGRHAGARMCGERQPFARVSQYATSVFECAIAFVGDVSMDDTVLVVARGAGTEHYGRLLVRNGKLRGATLINRTADRAPIAELIRRGTDLSEAEHHLADPSFDLKNLLG